MPSIAIEADDLMSLKISRAQGVILDRICKANDSIEIMAEPTGTCVTPLDSEFNTVELPPSIEIKESSVHKGEGGAFSKILIRKDTKFGPYKGEIITPGEKRYIDYRYAWEVFEKNSNVLKYTVSAMDPKASNWMRHVNCARFYEEQNIVSIQDGFSIFYVAMKDIKVGEELLTWFDPKLLKRTQRRLSKIERKPVGYTIELVPWSEEKKFVPEIIETKRARKKKVLSDMICLDEDPLAITRTLQRLPKIPASRKQTASSSFRETSPTSPKQPLFESPPKPTEQSTKASVPHKAKRGRKPKIGNRKKLNVDSSHTNGHVHHSVNDNVEVKRFTSYEQDRQLNGVSNPDSVNSGNDVVKVRKRRGRKKIIGLFGKGPVKVGRPKLRRTSDGEIAHDDLATLKPIIVKRKEDGSSIIEDHDETYTLRDVELRLECDDLCPCLDKQQAMGTHRSASPQKFKGFVIHFTLLPEHKGLSPDNKIIYRCDVCDSAYNHAFSLKRHYLSVHINHRYLSRDDILTCQIETFHTGVRAENNDEPDTTHSQPGVLPENTKTGTTVPIMATSLSGLSLDSCSSIQNTFGNETRTKEETVNFDLEKHLLCEETLNDEEDRAVSERKSCYSEVPALRFLAQKCIDLKKADTSAILSSYYEDKIESTPVECGKANCHELILECHESLGLDLLCPDEPETSDDRTSSSGNSMRSASDHERPMQKHVTSPSWKKERLEQCSEKDYRQAFIDKDTVPACIPVSVPLVSVESGNNSQEPSFDRLMPDSGNNTEVSSHQFASHEVLSEPIEQMQTDSDNKEHSVKIEPIELPSDEQNLTATKSGLIEDKSSERESQNGGLEKLTAVAKNCHHKAIGSEKSTISSPHGAVQLAASLLDNQNVVLSDTKSDPNENILKETPCSVASQKSVVSNTSDLPSTLENITAPERQTELAEKSTEHELKDSQEAMPCINKKHCVDLQTSDSSTLVGCCETKDNNVDFSKELKMSLTFDSLSENEALSSDISSLQKPKSNPTADVMRPGDDVSKSVIHCDPKVQSSETISSNEASMAIQKYEELAQTSVPDKSIVSMITRTSDPASESSMTSTPVSMTSSSTTSVAGTQSMAQNPVPQQVIFVTNIVFPIVSPSQKQIPTSVTSQPSSTVTPLSLPATSGPVTSLTSQAPGVPLVLISQLPHSLNVQNAANAFLQSSTALKTLQSIQNSLNVVNVGNTATQLSSSHLSTGNVPFPTAPSGSAIASLPSGMLSSNPALGSSPRSQVASSTLPPTSPAVDLDGKSSSSVSSAHINTINTGVTSGAKMSVNDKYLSVSNGRSSSATISSLGSPMKNLPSPASQPEDLFRCHMCVLVFKTMSELKRHIKNDPHRFKGGIKQYACLQCSMRFSNKNNLMRHNLMNHPENENYPFRCFTCGKGFSSETYLKMHARFHSGKNFPCKYGCVDVCFPNAASLVKHLRAQHAGLNLKEYLKNAKAEKARRKKLNRLFGVTDEQIAQLGITGNKMEEKPKPAVVPYSLNQPGVGFQAKRGRPKGSKNVKRIKDVFLERKPLQSSFGYPQETVKSHGENKRENAKELALRFKCKNCEKLFPTHLKLLQHRTRKHGIPQSVQEYLYQMSRDVHEGPISEGEHETLDISPPSSPRTFFSSVNRRGFQNMKEYIDGKEESLKSWRKFLTVKDYISISDPILSVEQEETKLEWTTFNFPPCFQYKNDCTTFYDGMTTTKPDSSRPQIKPEVLDDVDSSTENAEGFDVTNRTVTSGDGKETGDQPINSKTFRGNDQMNNRSKDMEDEALPRLSDIKKECLDISLEMAICDDVGDDEVPVLMKNVPLHDNELRCDENKDEVPVKQEPSGNMDSDSASKPGDLTIKSEANKESDRRENELSVQNTRNDNFVPQSSQLTEILPLEPLFNLAPQPGKVLKSSNISQDHIAQTVSLSTRLTDMVNNKQHVGVLPELPQNEKHKILQSPHIQALSLEQCQNRTNASVKEDGETASFMLFMSALNLHTSGRQLSSKQLNHILETTKFSPSLGFGRHRTLSLPSLGIMSPIKRPSQRYYENTGDTPLNTSDCSRPDHRRYSIMWSGQFHRKSDQKDKTETFCCPVVEAVRKQESMQQKKIYEYEKAAREKEMDKKKNKAALRMEFAENIGLMSRREFEVSHHAKKREKFIIKPPDVWDNYENIWFGKKGTITVVCSICHRHFSAWDLCLRHQLKKHPHIEPSSLEMERDNYVEDLYYYYPMQYGILAQTALIPDNLPPPEVYVCTRCGFPFKNLNKLHAHIVACDPIQEDVSATENGNRSKPSFMKKKLLPIMNRRLNQSFDSRPRKGKVGRPFKNATAAGRVERKESTSGPQSSLKAAGLATTDSAMSQEVHIISTIPTASEHKVVQGRPSFASSFSLFTGRRRKNYELLYNPQNHTRRRELYKVLDQHQCHGCNLKFKSLSLLERHVKKCSGKDKLRSQKPLLSGIMPDDAALRKQHTCRYCSKRFTYIKGVDLHYKRICTVRKVKEEENTLTKEDLEHEAELRRIIEHMKWSKSLNKDSSDIIQGHVRVEEDGSLTRVVKKRGWPRGLKKKVKKKGYKWTTLKRHRTDDDISATASSKATASPESITESIGIPEESVEEEEVDEDTTKSSGEKRITRSASLEGVQLSLENTRKRKTYGEVDGEERPSKRRNRALSQISPPTSLNQRDSQSSNLPETRSARRTGQRGRPQKFSPDDYERPLNQRSANKQVKTGQKAKETTQENVVAPVLPSQSSDVDVGIKPPARKRGRPKKYDPSEMESTYKKRKKAELLPYKSAIDTMNIISSQMSAVKHKPQSERDSSSAESSVTETKSSETSETSTSFATSDDKRSDSNMSSSGPASLSQERKDLTELDSEKMMEKMKLLKDAAKLEASKEAKKITSQHKLAKGQCLLETKKSMDMDRNCKSENSDLKSVKVLAQSSVLLTHLTKEEDGLQTLTKTPQISKKVKDGSSSIPKGAASSAGSTKLLPTVTPSPSLKRKASKETAVSPTVKKSQLSESNISDVKMPMTTKTVVHIKTAASSTTDKNSAKSAKISKESNVEKEPCDNYTVTTAKIGNQLNTMVTMSLPIKTSTSCSTMLTSQSSVAKESVSAISKPSTVSVKVVTVSSSKLNLLSGNISGDLSSSTTTSLSEAVTPLTTTSTSVTLSVRNQAPKIQSASPCGTTTQLATKLPTQRTAELTQDKNIILRPTHTSASKKSGLVICSAVATTGSHIKPNVLLVSAKPHKHKEQEIHSEQIMQEGDQDQHERSENVTKTSSAAHARQASKNKDPAKLHAQSTPKPDDILTSVGDRDMKKGVKHTKIVYSSQDGQVIEELTQETQTSKSVVRKESHAMGNSGDNTASVNNPTNQKAGKLAVNQDQSLVDGEVNLLCTARQSVVRASQKSMGNKVLTQTAMAKQKQNIISSLPQTQVATKEQTHIQSKGGVMTQKTKVVPTQPITTGTDQVRFISPSKLSSSNVALGQSTGLPAIRLANPASLTDNQAPVPTIILPSSAVRLPAGSGGMGLGSAQTTRITSPPPRFVSPHKLVTLTGTVLPSVISGSTIPAGTKLLKLGNIPGQVSTSPPITIPAPGAKGNSAGSKVIPAIVAQRPLLFNAAQLPRSAVLTGPRLQRPGVPQTILQRPAMTSSQIMTIPRPQGGGSTKPLVMRSATTNQQIYIQHPSGTKNIVTVAQSVNVGGLSTVGPSRNVKPISAVPKPTMLTISPASLSTNQIMFSLDDGTTAMLDPDSLAQFLSLSPPLNKSEPSLPAAKLMADPESTLVSMADIQPQQSMPSDDIAWPANGTVDLTDIPDSTCDL